MQTDSCIVMNVDLSTGKIWTEDLGVEIRRKLIGGRGVNAKIVYESTGPDVEPLSPDNVVVFGSGALSGTSAPCAARFNVSGKSPLTGILGDSNAGGFFGPAMRRAGIDHIVVSGKADKPVYLFIDNGRAELRNAAHIWGKDIRQTESIIKNELGDRRIRIASIGPAGERLVNIASVIHEERAAARTGMGAVMGSKNLKAVAVRGDKEVELYDKDGFNILAKTLQRKIALSSSYDHFRKLGASTGTFSTNKAGFLAVRNFQKAGGFEGIDNFEPSGVAKKFYKSSKACFRCPIGCGKNYIVSEGSFAGEYGCKIEEGAFTPLGPVCGNSNIESIFKMNNMGNQLGVDLIEFGQAMAVVMELYEKGIVTEKELDGISMTWGNYEAMISMLEKVAFRQGVGDLLSRGIVNAVPAFGNEAVKYASHSKGMVMAGIETRMLKGTALGFATSTRGADHLRALVPVEFPAYPVMTPEKAEEKFGTKEVIEPLSYNKAAALIYYQNMAVVPDLFEVCKFILGLGTGTKDFSYSDLFELNRLATGIELDEKEMLHIAGRVFNIERAYSCREGFGREQDRLEGKWADGGVPNGQYEGEAIDSRKWETMLDDYYRLRGWDENGVPGNNG